MDRARQAWGAGVAGWWLAALTFPWCCGATGAAERVAPPEVRLDGAVVRYLANPLTGEQYTIADDASVPQPEVTLFSSGGKRGSIASAGLLETQLIREANSVTIRQRMTRDEGGLQSIRLSIGSLDLTKVKLLIPGVGGVVIDAGSPLVSQIYDYPGQWSTPMLLIEGPLGGVAVWALDPQRPFLGLTVRRTATTVTFDLRTDADPPWPSRKQMASPVWHLQAYAGPWPAAAERFGQRLAKQFHLVELARRTPQWASRVGCFIRVLGGLTDHGHMRPKLFDALHLVASRMPPGRVVLYVPNWRAHPYDVMYPDYRPNPDAVVFTREARAMGFRVMLHGNLLGISPFHPRFKEFEAIIQRDPSTGKPVGWYLDRDVPNRIHCLNPAYPKSRKLLIESYRQARREIEFDAMHLDYPVTINTAAGRHEGLNTIGGTEVYLRELAEALPGIHFGCEGIADFLLPCSFAQLGEPFWNDQLQFGQYHPLRSFMFWPYCRMVGHLGIPDQQTALPKFLRFFEVHERTGTLPTLTVNSDTGLDPSAPGTSLALLQAAYWTDHLPVPDANLMVANSRPVWMRDGEPLFTWRLNNGNAAGVIQTRDGRQWIEQTDARQGKVRWGVVHGVNEVRSSRRIAGWLAYDAERIFGLNPSGNYLLTAQSRDLSAFHLAWTSQPVVVEAAETDAIRDLIRLGPLESVLLDLTQVTPDQTGVVSAGTERGLGWGATFSAAAATCGGERMPAVNAHPPWRSEGPPETTADLAPGALTFGQFRVHLPANAAAAFVTSIGLRDLGAAALEARSGHPLSDGVTFQVLVNGERRFQEHWTERRWKQIRVDLTPYAGRSVLLRLQTHPGPHADVHWDWASWGRPRIVRGDRAGAHVKLRIHQPLRVSRTIVSDAVSSRTEPGTVTAMEVTLPAAIVYPKKLRSIGADGADLLTLPFATYNTSAGLTQRKPVWGSGRIKRFRIDGIELPGVFGHPPDFGVTRLEWLLDLPASPLKLHFRVGLLTNGNPVTFKIRANNRLCWTHHLNQSSGWTDGEVDLSDFRGSALLLALVTDSAGSNRCDWAVWAQPRLVP